MASEHESEVDYWRTLYEATAAQLTAVTAQRDGAFETWRKFHTATLAAFIKNEHEPVKARLAEAERALREIYDYDLSAPGLRDSQIWSDMLETARAYFDGDADRPADSAAPRETE